MSVSLNMILYFCNLSKFINLLYVNHIIILGSPSHLFDGDEHRVNLTIKCFSNLYELFLDSYVVFIKPIMLWQHFQKHLQLL